MNNIRLGVCWLLAVVVCTWYRIFSFGVFLALVGHIRKPPLYLSNTWLYTRTSPRRKAALHTHGESMGPRHRRAILASLLHPYSYVPNMYEYILMEEMQEVIFRGSSVGS